ncbi:ArsR/SmtB family transcription factor [Paenibacillus taiwanensis]|uniref:ArsR/SmtB family transcription factor n=1 Tax=Paenibacillus taiwanensis TaxID=401638 RepID=UPI0004285332|nr:metalloregulator ArsR/SmtB family transcription factor [Paenibacillus taiwanensis]
MELLSQMSDQYKLLGDKTRLTIVALLNEQELCVCEIVAVLGLSQPNISQHLRKLKASGMIKETKKGQWVYYSINRELEPYLQDVLKHLPSMKQSILDLEEKGLKVSCD